jgi:FkbM family methyltransferase
MYRDFYASLLQQAGGTWFDFEGLIRDIYVALLEPGDTAVDAGAHKGDHTFQMAEAVGPTGRVIAIEAAPALLDNLFSLRDTGNRRVASVVDIRGIGLSDAHRTATFFYAPEAPGLSGLRNRDAVVSGRVIEYQVNLAPLDVICRSAPGPIRFIKLDIEGGEYDALRGATETLRRHRPVLVFEHDHESPAYFSYSVADLVDLLRSLDYHIFDFFANSYDDASYWEDTLMWNFVALPQGFPNPRIIFDAVRKTLGGINVRY